MDANRVVKAIQQYPIVFGLICLLGAVLGSVWAAGQPASYEATSRIVIGPAEDIEDPNDRIQVGQVLNHPVAAANLSELLTSDRVLSDSLRSSGILRSAVVDDVIEAIVAPESNVVQVKVTSSDPDRPVALISPLTESGVALFEDIYNVYRAEVIDLDVGAEEREPPSALFGAVVGLIGGSIMAVLACLFVDGLNVPRPYLPRSSFPSSDPQLAEGAVPQQASLAAVTGEHDVADIELNGNGLVPSKLDRAGTLRAERSGPLRAEASYPMGPGSDPDPEPVPAWPYETPMTDVELQDLLEGNNTEVEVYGRESPGSSAVS